MAMTTKQAAEKWGISDRRVRTLCVNGQIDGAWREGKLWFVPDNAPKPADGRVSALLIQHRPRVDNVALVFGHLDAVFIADMAKDDNVLERSAAEHQRGDSLQRVARKDMILHIFRRSLYFSAFWNCGIFDPLKKKEKISEQSGI